MHSNLIHVKVKMKSWQHEVPMSVQIRVDTLNDSITCDVFELGTFGAAAAVKTMSDLRRICKQYIDVVTQDADVLNPDFVSFCNKWSNLRHMDLQVQYDTN